MKLDRDSIQVVAAIDFGTSCSGYAFSYKKEPKKILKKTKWTDSPTPYVKNLTNILYNPQQEFMAWGWQARTRYAHIKGAFENPKDYDFFENFKMLLREKKEASKDGPIITADSGNKYLLLNVISDYLQRLKEQTLQHIQSETAGKVSEQSILWCLTVPAIWTDAEKQLMRRAAKKAGLIGDSDTESERLLLVLEPEAAAIYCLENEIEKSHLTPGSRLMVVDSGGGTVDITVHEVVEEDSLREVVEGTGGTYGSTYVDRNFEDYLKLKFSNEVIDKYGQDYPLEYLEMMAAWERAKCDFDPQRSNPIILFPLGGSFYRFLSKQHPQTLERLADEQNGDDGRIYIDHQIMIDIFNLTLNGLVKKVEEQFQKLDDKGCDFIYLVGGFSNSPLLQKRIEEEFRTRITNKIIRPQRADAPGAAIVEGAVLYGWNPPAIAARCSRLTYGCKVSSPFQPEVDPEEKKYWAKDYKEDYCRDRFDIFVRAGDLVNIKENVSKIYCPMEQEQKSMHLAFYASENCQVRYTDERGVNLLGEMVVEMPETTDGLNRRVDVTMYFGRTEIQVEARDITSGKEYNISLLFSFDDSQELNKPQDSAVVTSQKENAQSSEPPQPSPDDKKRVQVQPLKALLDIFRGRK